MILEVNTVSLFVEEMTSNIKVRIAEIEQEIQSKDNKIIIARGIILTAKINDYIVKHTIEIGNANIDDKKQMEKLLNDSHEASKEVRKKITDAGLSFGGGMWSP